MGKWKEIGVFLFVACLLSSCQHSGPSAAISFYHWKQVLAPEPSVREFLEKAGVVRLFVRFFDVDLDPDGGAPRPLAELEYRGGLPAGVRIVPVVFLAERVLRADNDPGRLAERVAAKIERIAVRCGFTRPEEVQLDCDWTDGSRDRFFAFLEAMKRSCPPGTALSVTLRLHQVKFREREGVPPVDRATLMLYNMGRIESPAAGNSIIDVQVLDSYADALADYPIPFDLALPIYRWGLIYRLDRLAQIVNDMGEEDLAAAAGALEPLGRQRFLCRREAHLRGATFFPGDLLRLEAADFPAVSDCLRLARRRLNGKPAALVFYHLDAGSIARFGPERLLRLAHAG